LKATLKLENDSVGVRARKHLFRETHEISNFHINQNQRTRVENHYLSGKTINVGFLQGSYCVLITIEGHSILNYSSACQTTANHHLRYQNDAFQHIHDWLA
jgi:hypothetical protein